MAETSSHDRVMGVVEAFCVFSQLVSQQNHSDWFLKALDVTLKWFYKMNSTSHHQTMLKPVQANISKQLERECRQLQEWMIYKICTAMDVHAYRAVMVSTTKWRLFGVHHNGTWQQAIKLSDVDRQKVKESLGSEIQL